MSSSRFSGAFGLAVSLVLAACLLAAAMLSGGGEAEARARGAASLKEFRSCDQLRGYLRDHRRALVPTAPVPVPTPLPPAGGIEDGGAGGAPGASAPAGEADAPSSSTNVQEQGIDEPDIVKADDELLLVLADGRLRAVELGGPEPRLLDSLEIPGAGRGGGAPYYFAESEMLVAADRALVIVPSSPQATISEVDLTDPAKLRVVRTMSVEGEYVDARLHESTGRIVLSTYPELPVSGESEPRQWMPRATHVKRLSGKRNRRRLLGCKDVARPSPFSGGAMLTVLTVDMRRGLPAVDSDAVMTAGQIAYASRSSLYIATEQWRGPSGIREPSEPSEISTTIHRFALDDEDTTRHVASGEVPGYMLGQWSMSEHEGLLRVATTTAPPWQGSQAGQSESIVSVLEQRSEKLAEVGSVGGLGRGESIYAVRFIDEVGYVVTFRQVDPLYVVDLSDPRDPRVRGELKVPGYSAYLHPVAEGRLLGVGQSATEEGRTRGSQLSLFDVSNLNAPGRLDQEELGEGSYSEVESTHRAFFFSPANALGVIPLSDFDPAFSGAVGFRIAGDQITDPTRLSHGDSPEDAIRRAFIAGGVLYTVSAAGVMAHDPETLSSLGFLSYGR